MKKTVSKALFVTALTCVTAFAAPSHADKNYSYDSWNNHGRYKSVDPFDRRFNVISYETLSIDLKRTVRNKSLPLRKMFGLNRDYFGQSVQKVVVHLKPRNKKTKLRLIANGRVVDKVVARGSRVVVLDPHHNLKLGRNVSSLKLKIDGKAHIRRINVQLKEKRPRYAANYGYRKS
ncbi:MAG: hypothetical protein MI743_12010 [Sneathiellales bacterium]|nr:hypothetical protein [Sneathiellales bacterium]